MPKEFDRRNLDFILKEVFNYGSLCDHPRYADYTPDMFDMLLDSAEAIAERYLRPHFVDADRNQAELVNGTVQVHSSVEAYVKEMGESGMIGATFSYEKGGQQLPSIVGGAHEFIRGAANNSVVMFTGLSNGAAHLIASFGSEELKNAFVPNMLSGKWTGTMCLTEPQAGSSLNDVSTRAIDLGNGSYSIKGQKVFISGGDNHFSENIIHLVLARLEGAPKGTKGISLFVVPKRREENGQWVSNEVTSMGIYHKMGQKAMPAMHLSFGDKGDSIGYLVGEPNKGLSYMFQMMNEARLGVGMGGAYIASAAYHFSKQYASERSQGRKLTNKDPETAPTLIQNHPDVQRMLYYQKSICEGAMGLLFQCFLWEDYSKCLTGEEKQTAQILLDLMTPVAKTYPAEMGQLSVNQGLQVLGGYGYTEDFPLEQMVRDARIMSIYEGTTGIHGLTLLGRGIPSEQGKAVQALLKLMQEDIQKAQSLALTKPYADQLANELASLNKVTMHKLSKAAQPDVFLADATLYMDLFGLVVVAWQWLKQGNVAAAALATETNEKAFYQDKIHTMKFFYHYEVPRALGLTKRLLDDEILTIFE
jgi:alkylation response protein AidB-like acyl-CoA dehydrogenase